MRRDKIEHPRPQFIREQWMNLNGSWLFCFDDEDRGLTMRWAEKGIPEGQTILVPYTYETPKSGIGDEGEHKVVWYQKTVQLTPEMLEGRILLHFEGVDYHASVWVNGQAAGEHVGGYDRFSMDISPFVFPGGNEVVVRACDSLSEEQVRGKQRWKKDSYACWYVQTTGIWKTVWLECVGKTYLRDVKITPCLEHDEVLLEAVVAGDRPNGMDFEAEVFYDGLPVAKGSVQVRQGRANLRLNLYHTGTDFWGIMKWTPDMPNLYDVQFFLSQEKTHLDRVCSYFGMRSVSIKGDQVLLNGYPIYQKLVLYQGYWKESHLTPPDEDAIIADIDAVLRFGFNGVRVHQKVEDERFLYWCDVKGLLVWGEMPSFYRYTDDAITAFGREWASVVRQVYNHPSIITWTPLNESWGIPKVYSDRRQQAFTQAIYHMTKALDGERPVIVNDGWEHTVSDIVTLHDYEENSGEFEWRYTDYWDELMDGRRPHCDTKYAMAQGFYAGGRPVMISEYGGIAFCDGQGWGYGSQAGDEEAFFRRFAAITKAIMGNPNIYGFCYTQLTDVQQEVNGLLDAERREKVDAGRIRKILNP